MSEHLTQESFKSKVYDFEKNKEWKYEGDLPAIIDFYADWCSPCKAIAPVLEELASRFAGKMHVYKVDTEAEPELSAMFDIQSIPTLFFVPKDGDPRFAQGALPKKELERAIAEVLKVE
ncbi:MAG: thioredoxin [Spirochaetota bacterium]